MIRNFKTVNIDNYHNYHDNLNFFHKFEKLAIRTFPDLGSHISHLVHMVFGLNSEMNELEDAFSKKDIVNVSEELSDIMWYFACYIYIRNNQTENNDTADYHYITLTLTNFVDKANIYNTTNIFGKVCNFFMKRKITEKHIKLLYYNISLLQDSIKKLFAYKQSYNTYKEFSILLEILLSIRVIFYVNNLDFEKSLMNVIDKLIKRYPEKFTEYLAQNRNFEAERKELEK